GQRVAVFPSRVPFAVVACDLVAQRLNLALAIVQGGLRGVALCDGRVALLAGALQFAGQFPVGQFLAALVLLELGLKRFSMLRSGLVLLLLALQLFLQGLLRGLVLFQLALQGVVTLLPEALVLLARGFQLVAKPDEPLVFFALG